ncbi:phosphonate C-P lyase system protein PhnH [Pseudomonas sp. S9]|uniref:phosphonate C-P lyase system protein PhnH n=1 Tax=Pseudomonas sp. S9 TaxID=686578 RepID=UPI0002556825|nr:phosphonate C-P lyase system protein PhnH [Pseudomonas sp. S9]
MSAALGIGHELDTPVLEVPVVGRSIARQAMASPGQIQSIDWIYVPQPLDEATFALCMVLLDVDSPLWLGPSLDTPELRRVLALHCRCSIVELPQAARFALLGACELNDLHQFDNGVDGIPSHACTLIVQLDNLCAGPELRWRGPGIRQATSSGVVDVRRVSLPLDRAFWQQRKDCNNFPQGLDMFFSAGRQILALPRSTHVLGAVVDTD